MNNAKNKMLLSDLKSAEYNPRDIDYNALRGLKYSLDEFGDISGIVYNNRTGRLVAGHQRVKALKDNYGNLELINDCIITPKGIFPVRFVDWDESKEKAANIAANSETIQGRWTEDASLIIEDVAMNIPEYYQNLNFSYLNVPLLSVPIETIEVEKQTSNISQEHRNSLKFGDVTIYLSDKELNMINAAYKNYIEMNRTNFGFITYLIDGE